MARAAHRRYRCARASGVRVRIRVIASAEPSQLHAVMANVLSSPMRESSPITRLSAASAATGGGPCCAGRHQPITDIRVIARLPRPHRTPTPAGHSGRARAGRRPPGSDEGPQLERVRRARLGWRLLLTSQPARTQLEMVRARPGWRTRRVHACCTRRQLKRLQCGSSSSNAGEAHQESRSCRIRTRHVHAATVQCGMPCAQLLMEAARPPQSEELQR